MQLSSILAFWAIAVLGLGCVSQPEGLRVSGGDGAPPSRGALGYPILIQQSDYVMFPFALHGAEQGQSQVLQLGSSNAGSGSQGVAAVSDQSNAGFALARSVGDYYASNILWNNVLFCDRKSAECHLLLDRKAVICKIYLPDPSQPKKPGNAPKYLLFAIADEDTNGDGYINCDDAVVLYLSDLSGKSLTRLTPVDTQLVGIELVDSDDAAYARIRRKPPGAKGFRPDDESLILRVDLHHPAEGTPIPDEQLRSRAMSILTGR